MTIYHLGEEESAGTEEKRVDLCTGVSQKSLTNVCLQRSVLCSTNCSINMLQGEKDSLILRN